MYLKTILTTTSVIFALWAMMEVESTNFEILEGAEVEPFLDKIGKFLYDVYINELDWKFGADNPSKITIEMDGQDNKMLVDKFMKDKDFIQKTCI